MFVNALKFLALALAAACCLTLLLAWGSDVHSIAEIVNVTTLVSAGIALVAFPMVGSGGSTQAHADPRRSEEGPDQLDNRARGVLLLAVAGAWFALSVIVHRTLGS